jgi:hypothetical protein
MAKFGIMEDILVCTLELSDNIKVIRKTGFKGSGECKGET